MRCAKPPVGAQGARYSLGSRRCQLEHRAATAGASVGAARLGRAVEMPRHVRPVFGSETAEHFCAPANGVSVPRPSALLLQSTPADAEARSSLGGAARGDRRAWRALPFPWRRLGRHHHGARALDPDRAGRACRVFRARTGEGRARAVANGRKDGAQAESSPPTRSARRSAAATGARSRLPKLAAATMCRDGRFQG
jgi:hypothetical protein